MLKILAYKKFCTSIVKKDKLHIATACSTEGIRVTKYFKKDNIYTFVIGFFTIKNTYKYNRSLLNGMYQKDSEIKNKNFRISHIKDCEENKNIIKFLLDKNEAKQSVSLSELMQFYDSAKVTGMPKGRGFMGGMKRHGFSGLNKTHGVTLKHRCGGSTGSRNANHIIKGKRMAGRSSNKSTVKKIKIFKEIDISNINQDVIILQGSIPGHINTLLEINF